MDKNFVVEMEVLPGRLAELDSFVELTDAIKCAQIYGREHKLAMSIRKIIDLKEIV